MAAPPHTALPRAALAGAAACLAGLLLPLLLAQPWSQVVLAPTSSTLNAVPLRSVTHALAPHHPLLSQSFLSPRRLPLTLGSGARGEPRPQPHPFGRPANAAEIVLDDPATLLSATVLQALRRGVGLLPAGAPLAPSLTLVLDLSTHQGEAAYRQLAQLWERRAPEMLPELRLEVSRVRAVTPTRVVAQWTAYWVPLQSSWLVSLARAWPGVRIEWFDLLDRIDQRSSFSWAAVRRLFCTAATEGVMRLPVAAMPSTTTFEFDETGRLLRQSESLALVDALRRGEVQNKKVARDVMDFMIDVRQPLHMSLEDWDRQLCRELRISQVPGMRPLDIDGLEPETQSAFIEDVSVLLSLLVAVVLAFGAASGYMYYQTLQERAAMVQRLVDTGADVDYPY